MGHFGEKVWFRKIWGRWCQFICKAHDSRNLLSVIMIEQEQCLYHQEGSHARQKLDETDTERCMGRDELGRLVWHAVANGGS